MNNKTVAVLIGIFFSVSALFLEKHAIDFIFSKAEKIRLKNRRRKMSNDNRCIFCGEQIPEGMQVCPNHAIPISEDESKPRISIDLPDNSESSVCTSSVKKSSVDELVRLTKKYASTDDGHLLNAKTKIARRLSGECLRGSNSFMDIMFNSRLWLSYCDFISAICGTQPLCENVTNETIYKLFEMLGIKVEEG